MGSPLRGLDATFLYAESPTAHMHTLKVLVLERPRGVSDLGGALARALRSQLDRLPALRLRPRSAGLWHPTWERVDVDLALHVTLRPVWLTAGHVERAIGDFASRPLRRDRPLWEMLALDDRARGQLTLVLKIHHALADGRAAERMLERAAGALDEGIDAPRERSGIRRRPRAPGGALARALRAVLGLGALLLATVVGLVRAAREGRRFSDARGARPFGGVPTSFTRPITADRRVAFASLPFDAVLGIKRAAGVTVNDVVLTLVGGALRRYLAARGEGAERPLVAAMPVGVKGAAHAVGNRLSNVLVPIHVEEAAPLSRLRRTARSAARAKARHEARGADLMMRWSELAPAPVVRALWWLVRRSRRAPVDLVVSNVPGPRAPLRVGGARLKAIYSVGPLLETTGLNVTFWSYAGRLNACILACGDHGTDPGALAAELERALEELRGAPALAPAA
ncbi:MAG TPA: wax ester/triacylglycerol synthase family O-acyltransferase [Sandaracinaceae bacterium LLY-WYZ-13_1]|nr:wax ester/triacylglycerol synthase family O-acyltransferase [Sandaracinaceae bacterium LLY-WYZ-13_1]